MGEALDYALAQWERFEEYLWDGRLEIDSNLVENGKRPTERHRIGVATRSEAGMVWG
jgi:hypothetical protein